MPKLAIIPALRLFACSRPAEDTQPANLDTVAEPLPEPAEPLAQGNSAAPAASADKVSACLMQGGERLAENALRAIGTEPFWAAEVKGRCVTYSTPENQRGVRIWTRFEGTSESGQWRGALDGLPFVMTTRPEPGCSDGMSDKSYPVAVTLDVGGEERRGCAERR